jgi:two-component system, LytTR family, response regulator
MKEPLKALIIDDERLARRELRTMLAGSQGISVIGEADGVPSAIKAIKELDPDVLFLDIQMPGQSGFDLLDKIEIDAEVVFVTAYDEFALRAFEVNALDYLLKPVTPDRLEAALDRLRHSDTVVPASTKKLAYDDCLFLSFNTQTVFLKVNTIVSVRAAGDYTEVTINDGRRGLTPKSMKEWDSRLPGQQFARIHRSTIINVQCVSHLEEWFNQSYRVYLEGVEGPFILSRRYAAKLKEQLG